MENPPSTERTGPQKGDIIEGKLEIEAILAEGATSTVVSATDRASGKKVAVKIARGSDLEASERFRRAAHAMAKLKSPFSVRVLAVGQTQDGVPCMSMEYLEGKTLALTLLQRGPIPVDDAVRWIKQACEAVTEAHAQRLLHRDLDAENLFLAMPPIGTSGPPSVRVLDYGLSPVWRTNKTDGRLKPGEVPGTSFALPPELVRGGDLDDRVDVWGLGACLFRLLTNRYPFGGRNLAELCAKVLAERAPDLSKLRADVTPALAAVVRRCLEREPDDRYPSMRAVLVALEEAQDDAPNTPQVPTERAVLDHLRHTPIVTRAAEPAMTEREDREIEEDEDPTGIVGIGALTPATVRTVPRHIPQIDPPIEPATEDGPSTQPLGRLSPFAELPKAPAPEPVSAAPPSEDDQTIAPMFAPVSEKFAVPKPRPALPIVSAATAAQETLPGGPGSPNAHHAPSAPNLVFQAPARSLQMLEPTPPPPIAIASALAPAAPILEDVPFAVEETPRRRSGVIPLVFLLGISVSATIGLYVARMRIPPSKPPTVAVAPAASTPGTAPVTTSTVQPVQPVASDSNEPADADSSEPPVTAPSTTSSHRRRPRPVPSATPSGGPAPSHTGSIYDPSQYDSH